MKISGGDTSYSLSLLREAYEMRQTLGLPHTQALVILYETARIWYQRKEYAKAIQVSYIHTFIPRCPQILAPFLLFVFSDTFINI